MPSDSKDAKALLTETELREVADFELTNKQGEKVKFGSLFENQKTLVIFVRHFFCGACQDYTGVVAKVRQEALEAAGTKIVIIGHSEHDLIPFYEETTGFKGDLMYAEPTRVLYEKLGMTYLTVNRTPKGEKKPSYLTLSLFQNVARSIYRALKVPTLAHKGGDVTQNGGEFILGPGLTCTFASRMKHTEDHIEVADLMKELGVEYP